MSQDLQQAGLMRQMPDTLACGSVSGMTLGTSPSAGG
jgi:hypothetical protein